MATSSPVSEPSTSSSSATEVKIVTWNVNGVKSKKDTICEHLKNYDADIYFIQETHLAEEQTFKLEIEDYDSYHAAYNSQMQGVSTLIKKGHLSILEEPEIDSEGRYIIIRGSFQGTTLTLVNVYVPGELKIAEFESFFEELFENLQTSDNIIMAGDFNTVMDAELDCTRGKLKWPGKTKKIQSYMDKYDLCDSWRRRNPQNKEFTFIASNGTKSRLDFFLLSESLMRHVTNNEIERFEECSDHAPVSLTMLFQTATEALAGGLVSRLEDLSIS